MSGTLFWCGEALERLRAEIRVAQSANSAADFWGDAVRPGIVLVGDHGVYLMAWCHRAPSPEKSGIPAAYAAGCDPSINDDFYDRKHAVWGGNDGAEYFALDAFVPALEPCISRVSIAISRTALVLNID